MSGDVSKLLAHADGPLPLKAIRARLWYQPNPLESVGDMPVPRSAWNTAVNDIRWLLGYVDDLRAELATATTIEETP